MIINKVERNTEQKKVILDCLKSIYTHPTAEGLHKLVKKKLPSISLATIYRNLNQMSNKGKILRLEINKEYHYDGHIGNHQHFICENCGNIKDISDKNISEYVLNRVKDNKIQIASVSVIFHGKCMRCKN
jgi:Fe2+ or Zn2+ uptake regulation protein